MEIRTNAHGQPVGAPVEDWTGCAAPPRTPMQGRFVRVEPLDPDLHAPSLIEAYAEAGPALWTYMAVGPFDDASALRAWLEDAAAGDDPMFHAIVDLASGRALGLASFMRLQPAVGVVEVGNISYAPALQRTAQATEAMHLMACRVFDELGYRRYEWKCDALNAPSRRAAARLGFSPDGLFPQALVYKGRNRDTAWFSMLDRDWPSIRAANEAWLDPSNFDADGRQRRPLRDGEGRS